MKSFLCSCGRCIKGSGNFKQHTGACTLKPEDYDRIREAYADGEATVKNLRKTYSLYAINYALKEKLRSSLQSRLKRAAIFGNKCGRAKTALGELNRKQKIAKQMKKAHQEGRAVGWKRKESWPEKFFNNFLVNTGFVVNKDYLREFYFGRFAVDFFFPDKRLVFEIDGEQHFRYKEIYDRDRIKDSEIRSKGIFIIRIAWKDLFHNAKERLGEIEQVLKSSNISDVRKRVLVFYRKYRDFVKSSRFSQDG